MHTIDWVIVVFYLAGMIGLSVYLGRGQKDDKDYYLGGNKLSWWSIGISTMATQCSTNSLLGAPAFVAFTGIGGLVWLQYELAVPFAMIFVMMFLLPFYRSQGVVSVYEYLEKRFDVKTRTLLSILFQFIRAFGTGVTVYGVCLILEKTIQVPFAYALILLGIITVVYDMIGGMKAVVISDVVQMAVLYIGLLVCLFAVVNVCGGWSGMFTHLQSMPERLQTIRWKETGLGDGSTFSFWPMFLGGFFLYCSYYGCDQSQVQRELAAKDLDDTNMSLFLNGIIRFPLVLTYCFLGLGIAAYTQVNPEFTQSLITAPGNKPEYNLAVPTFVLQNLSPGIIGLIFVALFSAAMSSLDSTINSLSATTMRDILERFFPIKKEKTMLYSKLLTLFWGTVCVIFAFFVGDISDSILESINKIGSLANGPILATFVLAILTKRANGNGTFVGIIAGFAVNLYFWKYVPNVSWMWWNVIGCLVTLSVGYGVSLIFSAPDYNKIKELLWENRGDQLHFKKNWSRYYWILAGYGVFLIVFCSLLERWLLG